MTNRVRWRALAALLALALGLGAAGVRAQCAPDQVLVGEDANYYYCKDRKTYAACIGAAGVALRDARPACAAEAGQCFQNEGQRLNDAGLACVLGCLGSLLSPARCTAACGLAGVIATRSVEKCGVDLGNRCFGDALLAHRRRVQACAE